MDTMMGKAMLITWAGLGIKIEHEVETQESLTIYISVPEKSYMVDAHGDNMSGLNLARSFKKTLTDIGVKRLTVKSRIRSGENWTKEDDSNAQLEIRKKLFGSQY